MFNAQYGLMFQLSQAQRALRCECVCIESIKLFYWIDIYDACAIRFEIFTFGIRWRCVLYGLYISCVEINIVLYDIISADDSYAAGGFPFIYVKYEWFG